MGADRQYHQIHQIHQIHQSVATVDANPNPKGENHEKAEDDDEQEAFIEELHEASANLLLLLAALHIGGGVLESRLSGQNLVRAMISGRRS